MAADQPQGQAGETPHRKIAADLRAEIDRGDYKPGHQLPSGSELMRRYNVARQTVQNAFDLLKAEGLVEARAGAGVFVRSRPAPQRIQRRRLVFRDKIGYYFDAAGQPLRAIETPKIDRVSASFEVARLLQVDQGESVVRRSRVLGYPDTGLGLQVAVSYLPAWLAAELPIIAEPDTGAGGIYDRIEEWSGTPLRWEEVQGAVPATDVEASALEGVSHGTALMRIARTAFLEDGRPVELNETRMDGARFEVVAELERDVSASWPTVPSEEKPSIGG